MYVLSLRRRDMPAAYTRRIACGRQSSASASSRRRDDDLGAFCAGCHGRDGQGRRSPGMAGFPAIANPDFQSRVSDEFLVQTVTHGRPGRRHARLGRAHRRPAADEIGKAVEHLRELSGVAPEPEKKPPRWLRPTALWASACSPRPVPVVTASREKVARVRHSQQGAARQCDRQLPGGDCRRGSEARRCRGSASLPPCTQLQPRRNRSDRNLHPFMGRD